jgi:hypothetical protein
MTVATLIVCFIALGAVILVLSGKHRETAPVDAVWIANQGVLEAHFGHELSIENGKIIEPINGQSWFVKLREHRTYGDDDNDHNGYSGCSDCVIRTHDDDYLHIIVRSYRDRRFFRQISKGTPVITKLSELRARRALFNHADEYQRAFGQTPDAAHLKLVANVQDHKIEGDSAAMMRGSPLGNEFGAR